MRGTSRLASAAVPLPDSQGRSPVLRHEMGGRVGVLIPERWSSVDLGFTSRGQKRGALSYVQTRFLADRSPSRGGAADVPRPRRPSGA
jgi:hypothetical protein